MRAGRQLLPLLILLLCVPTAAPAGDPPRRFRAGRPLIEAIDALRARGLQVIYSSDLVRPEMKVLTEPVAAEPRGILEDLIAPHGLEARDGPAGTLLIVAAEVAEGPTGGVAGRVVSGGDRRPAPGAAVAVAGRSLAVVTAADGRFLIPRLPPGVWPLDVRSADGRMQQALDVPVRAGEVTRVAIELAHAPALVDGIVVTPTRYRIVSDEPEIRRSVQEEELAGLAHLGDDAHRAAARLPGAAAGDKSARFSLRGGEWNEVLVLLDGLEIDQPYHLKDFLAFSGIVDSRAIDRIDLLTGGFPAEYGGRMSGVMELASSIPSETSFAALGAGIPSSRVLAEGRTSSDDRRWLVSARTWYPDALLDLVDPGGEDINPYYSDLLGKIEVMGDGGTNVSGHVLASRDYVNFTAEDVREAAYARYSTAYAWMNVDSPWTPRLFSRTQISAGSIESNRRGGSEDPFGGSARITDERVSETAGARQDWLFRGSDRYLVKWGWDARTLSAEYESEAHLLVADPFFQPPAPPAAVDRLIAIQPSGSRLGAYASLKAKIASSLTAEAGVRLDRQTYSRDAQADPRVNLVWAAGGRSTLRAAWGLVHQPQRADELQVEDGVRRFFPAQRSEHRMLSFEHDSERGLHLRADVYSKVMSRLRPRFENLFNPIELFPEGGWDRVRIAPDRATAEGAEIYLRKQTARGIRWWSGYALASAEDEIGGRTEPRSWDQRHALGTGIGLRFGRGWDVELAGAWHSGWPTTRVDARAVTDPNGMVTIQPILGPRNAERFPPYHRLDLKVSRRVRLQGSTLAFFLEVLNVYGRRNVCCVEDFEFSLEPGGDVRVEREEGHWLERLPSFGVSWEF